MRSDTQSVTVAAPAGDVFGGEAWVVTTSQGAEVKLRYLTDPGLGTIDFEMEPAPGAVETAYARVVPNGEGADVVFTQQQAPGMTDDVFDAQVAALRHELTVLKALVEVACPT
jgi:hypothetical protein